MIMSSYFNVQYLHQKMIRIYADIVKNRTLPVFPNFWRAVQVYYKLYEYKYIHVNTCKYFQNIYCMCVYLYMHNIHSTHRYVNKNY